MNMRCSAQCRVCKWMSVVCSPLHVRGSVCVCVCVCVCACGPRWLSTLCVCQVPPILFADDKIETARERESTRVSNLYDGLSSLLGRGLTHIGRTVAEKYLNDFWWRISTQSLFLLATTRRGSHAAAWLHTSNLLTHRLGYNHLNIDQFPLDSMTNSAWRTRHVNWQLPAAAVGRFQCIV
jgi:hypothetical protein